MKARKSFLLGGLIAAICITTMGQSIIPIIVTTAYTRIFLRATTAAQALEILGITNAAPMEADSGYILKYDGTSITNSIAFETSTGIGIGTVTPAKLLDLQVGTGNGLVITRAAFSHGMSSEMPTNAFGYFRDLNGSQGGMLLYGASSYSSIGFQLTGLVGTNDPTDTVAAVLIEGSKKNGTGTQALGAAETVFKVRNRVTDIVTILGSGNVGFNTATFGTAAAKVLTIANGTSPTTFPADSTTIMSADQNGTAGNAALHIYPEAGATNIIGKWVQFPGGLIVGGTVTTDPANKLRVGTGVVADGGGMKHARVTTGSINAASSALVTNSWTTAFADANYTVVASVHDTTAALLSLEVIHVEEKSASGVSVRVNNTSAGALTGTLQLIAIHD